MMRRFYATASPVGLVLVLLGGAMSVPCGIALFAGGDDRLPLALSLGAAVALGAVLLALGGRKMEEPRKRDAILIVVMSWLFVGSLGALPFILSGVLTPIDALFESFSGFTTTGASVIPVVERLPAGLVFWRSLTHWLGGMGILVLAIAVLPFLGTAGYQLFKTEAPALEQDRLFPRMAQTVRALFAVYVLLTVAEAALLLIGGLSLFDAFCHAFGTIATGGFSTRSASVGVYGSLYIEVVVIVFRV